MRTLFDFPNLIRRNTFSLDIDYKYGRYPTMEFDINELIDEHRQKLHKKYHTAYYHVSILQAKNRRLLYSQS